MDNLINIDAYRYYYQLSKILNNYKNKEVVFFCVGNYKVWYDSFASNVGSMLKTLNINSFVYGGKDFPILPDVLTTYMSWVESRHPNACIIVVDNLLTFCQNSCGELVIAQRKTNISGLTSKLLFGDVSVLFRTCPYENYENVLAKQQRVINNLAKALEMLKKNTQNGKICI